MEIGTIIHHKYFNGVANPNVSLKYQNKVLSMFKDIGMHGTGMMNFITKLEHGNVIYDFSNLDKLVAFATKNHLNLHYNTVITGRLSAFPQYYSTFNNQKKLAFLESHVRKIISRYKNSIKTYKLVNEFTMEPEQNYLKTGLSKIRLINKIFEWAIDEFPQGKYILNEYGPLIRPNIKKDFLKIVSDLQSINTRIDIIGLQGHSGYFPKPFQIQPLKDLSKKLIDISSKTRLPIYITEFDLSYQNHTSQPYEGSSIDPTKPFKSDLGVFPTWFAYQKEAYNQYLKTCRETGVVGKVYFWSFIDDSSITWERPGCGILNSDYISKLD